VTAGFADQVTALFVFSLASGYTPGPNNVMLLASGVNHGFRRTVPHIAGVVIGFPTMAAAVALGLGALFRAHPSLHGVIEAVGVVYLLWLAARIGFQPVEGELETGAAPRRPFSFLEAATFQVVNVKGWITAISGASIYLPTGLTALQGTSLLFVVFFVNAVGSASTWAAFGTMIARLLGTARRRRIFNAVMASALVVSLWPAWVDLWRALHG
jgi:threonine/homoserine/homoserine lactone efflux protein